MLRYLPRVHAQYAASTNGALLADFAAWLLSARYPRHAIHGHVRQLKQALERMSSALLAPVTSLWPRSTSSTG
jgi:hypothetical protein